MGCYVNPEDGLTKEEFLEKNGIELTGWTSGSQVWKDKPHEWLPVVWLDNRAFTAAGVGFSERECQAFLDRPDHRPRKVFYVPIEELEKATVSLRAYMREGEHR